MNAIPRFYAHLYHTVPEKIGSRTKLAIVSTAATIALAALYPLATSLAVTAFLTAGVGSYFWAKRKVEQIKPDLVPENTSLATKVSLVFRAFIMPRMGTQFGGYSSLDFLDLVSPEMKAKDRDNFLKWLGQMIPDDQRLAFSRNLKALSIPRERITHGWDVICIFDSLRKIPESERGDRIEEAKPLLNHPWLEKIPNPAGLFPTVFEHELSLPHISKLLDFIGAKFRNTPREQLSERDWEQVQTWAGGILRILAATSPEDREAFVNQTCELLSSLPGDWRTDYRSFSIELIRVFAEVQPERRAKCLDAYQKWRDSGARDGSDVGDTCFFRGLVNARDLDAYVTMLFQARQKQDRLNAIMSSTVND